MKRFAEILRGLISLGVTLALTFVLPALLGPWSLGRLQEVFDVVGDPLASDSTRIETFLTAGLLVVFWLAWAMLVVSLLVEAAATVRGRAARQLPVFPGIQTSAARLVASIALIFSSFTAAIPATVSAAPIVPLGATEQVTALVSDAEITAPTSQHTIEDALGTDVVPAGPTYEVQNGDTWWSLGEQFLGDGVRWKEIVDTNVGLTMDDGTRLSPATQNPVAGWRIALPADADPEAIATAAERSLETTTAGPPSTGSEVPATYVVQDNDGMWNVAEALLGDGSRHVELHERLVGQEVAPGVIFTNDTYVIHPGWTFTAPDDTAPSAAETADTAEVHVVQEGETLSEIAEEHLGDGDEWPEIFEANEGREMGEGRTFDDPDLIVPGWEIDLPGPAESSADREGIDAETVIDADIVELNTRTDPASDTSSDRLTERTADTVGTVASTDADATLLPADVTPSEAAPLPPPVQAAPPAASLPAPTTTSPDVAVGGSDSGSVSGDLSSPEAPAPIRLEHAALLAAGLLALIGVRRRQRLRTAAPRSRVPEPSPDVVATCRRLRLTDPGERSARIDVAIRAAAHALVDTDVQVAVVTASVDGEVTVNLTAPATLPSPWTGSGTTWRVAASVPIEMLAGAARAVRMPIVAFVQIGVDDEGRDVLIDLEACGTFAVEAQPAQADEVIAAMAAGLATSPYAETAHLIGVAVPPSALLGHRNAFNVNSLDAGVEMAGSLVGSTVHNSRSTFALRSLEGSGEMWEPAVVLASSANQTTVEADAAGLPDPGHGIAVVAGVAPGMLDDANGRLTAGVDGWVLSAFGVHLAITPIGLSSQDLADISNALIDADAPLIEPRHLTPDASAVDDSPTLIDPADETILPSTPGADVSSPESGGESGDDFVPIDHEIMIRLFGSIEVSTRDGEVGKFERSKTVELIAWLATHRSRSTRSAARTALWELDVRDATFANVVSEARRALARMVLPPDGQEWVARTLTDQLPLHEQVVTDAQLIQQRLDAARLMPPSAAIEVLRPAAEMIHDMPFAGTNYLWPDAEGITSNLVLLATSVATELAAHALSMGDIDLVFWATGQGLAVLPGHEELIGLRMQAHAQAGDRSGVRQEWESYERVIIADAWSDGEPSTKLLELRKQLLETV